MIDGAGVYGNILHYALTLSFVGSAFVIFLFFLKKKNLGLDEEAKYTMLRDENE